MLHLLQVRQTATRRRRRRVFGAGVFDDRLADRHRRRCRRRRRRRLRRRDVVDAPADQQRIGQTATVAAVAGLRPSLAPCAEKKKKNVGISFTAARRDRLVGPTCLVELDVEEVVVDVAVPLGLFAAQAQQQLEEPLEAQQVAVDPHEIHLVDGRRPCRQLVNFQPAIDW